MQQPIRILSEHQAPPGSFHDCHVQGIRWRRDRFVFSMDLQYILEWIVPADGSAAGYRFSISEARLTFRDADELEISMAWSGGALDCQIDTLRILESRTTPNGKTENQYEIDFSDPDGRISIWSTGYELALLTEPVISKVTSIPMHDSD